MNKVNGSSHVRRFAGGCRPTPQQELLLRAAIIKGPGSIEAWRQWKSGVDIEKLDPASFRMLPHLYRILQSNGIGDPPRG